MSNTSIQQPLNMISERKNLLWRTDTTKLYVITCCHYPHRTLRRASRCDCTLSPPRCHSRGSDDEKFTSIVSLFATWWYRRNASLSLPRRNDRYLHNFESFGDVEEMSHLANRLFPHKSLSLSLIWKKRPVFVFFVFVFVVEENSHLAKRLFPDQSSMSTASSWCVALS